MQRDKATHVTFGKSSDLQTTFIFHMLRFLSGVHMFYALALFWSIPMCVMLMVGYSMIEYQGKLWDIWLLSVERMNSFPSPLRSTCPFWTSFNFRWVLQPSCSRRNLQLSRKVVLDCAVFDSLRSVHSLSFVWQYVRLGKAQKVGTLRLVRLSPRAPRGVLTSILQFHQIVFFARATAFAEKHAGTAGSLFFPRTRSLACLYFVFVFRFWSRWVLFW